MAGIVLNMAPTIGPGPWKPSKVVGTSSTVFAEGQQIVVKQDDQVIRHERPDGPDWKQGKVIASTSKVFVEGKPIAQIGDVCTDGEILVKSATSVFAS
ncbi:baseplate puncturing device [Aeromonas phage avDM12-TAAL]|nr:baseplate puncturing device [Aeromonas phage avDM12-TAAL]